MKVLIVNFSDIEGGAARAAYRLHQSLLEEQIDSKMLVLMKKSDDFTIISTSQTNFEKFLTKTQALFNILPVRRYKSISPFSASFSPSFNISKKINALNPEIVHLHWINAGMLRIEDLSKINAPIAWSLHDNWAFTGGCHIMRECEKYKKACGQCPVLRSKKNNDLSRKIFIRKQKTYLKISNLTIIGLSKWLANCARESTLFKGENIVNLPNPINTSVFKPFNKERSRELWGLPKNKKLVLFGANNATNDLNKGFKELSESLLKLTSDNIEFIVFGSGNPKEPQNFGFKTHYLGQLHDDVSLVTLYSAADVMLVPSLQENLSNVIMESLSCATPVVGFNIGGNSDLINHRENGYLATPFDTTDLAKGIEWVLNNTEYEDLCENARGKVLKKFDSKIVAKKYIDLYNKISTFK